MISRRQLLYFSAILSACSPVAIFKCFAAEDTSLNNNRYLRIVSLLKEAYRAEKTANRRYVEYSKKALSENYPNIAYLFKALSTSEHIHANNYKVLIKSLGSKINGKERQIVIGNTKDNLRTAAIEELKKINDFYPQIIRKLSSEAHDESVINCMYSWKSHQQHEKIIASIKRYSGMFFNPLAKKIENMDLNYHVCEICGSTINEQPIDPCEICNYPAYHYKNLDSPSLKNR